MLKIEVANVDELRKPLQLFGVEVPQLGGRVNPGSKVHLEFFSMVKQLKALRKICTHPSARVEADFEALMKDERRIKKELGKLIGVLWGNPKVEAV